MDDQIPTVAPGEMSAKQFRQNWARLIQKIYEVDPLICPKCLGDMHIVAFIDQPPVIEKILRHLFQCRWQPIGQSHDYGRPDYHWK